jgi:hypothetical protein
MALVVRGLFSLFPNGSAFSGLAFHLHNGFLVLFVLGQFHYDRLPGLLGLAQETFWHNF